MTTHPDQFAKRVLDRIEGEGLSPRPRWEFIFKNYVFWTLGALAIALGALAFAAGLFEVENAGWQYFAATHGDFFTFFLQAAPFLWVVALGLFLVIGYANIRRTKRGYRYPLAFIALGAVLTSLTLGTALYAAGFGEEIEEGIGDHPPIYRPIILEERGWWLSPEQGLLGGTVLSFSTSTGMFLLRDFSGHTWTVDAREVKPSETVRLTSGTVVRMVGAPVSATSSAFHACFVFPWKTRDGFAPASPGQPVAGAMRPASSSSERIIPPKRIELCKGISPYEKLRALDERKGI